MTTGITTVAVCCATGNQGKEVIQRFEEINETQIYGENNSFHIKALTRNASSNAAINILSNSPKSNVTLAEVEYLSHESLKLALQGADALYLNYAMIENEAEVEKTIIDAAISAGVKHIVFASHINCEKDHGVPHWESSRKTNEYLKECLLMAQAKQEDTAFRFHLVRLAAFNENVLSHFLPKGGKMTFPWRQDARFATASLRDVARVACKIIAQPLQLENGASIDVATEFTTSSDWATAISEASGENVAALKGPWIFTTFGHYFGWDASTILTMAEYIDKHELVDDIDPTVMRDFLQKEIEVEPLETVENFAKRHFLGSTEDDKEVRVSLWKKLMVCF